MPCLWSWREATKALRHSCSAVYLAFEGTGYSVIDGKRFDWSLGDVFVVPTWAWHEHRSGDEGNAVLFSIHNRPVIQALGLYREEPYEANGGHQPGTSRRY